MVEISGWKVGNRASAIYRIIFQLRIALLGIETKGKGARIIPRTSSRMEWKIEKKKMERDR